ncbi:hypothetical protein AVEN_174481-1 [Araneus ventricosus]|uniref:Uncharacterized protein n=1 Tax=Araneus ventricosus TaxID=182803 RepID=A0A4Y2UZ11_ARAVE|nr:hypothetical protein AVEN_174481-1 [Araneus ventricosus]
MFPRINLPRLPLYDIPQRRQRAPCDRLVRRDFIQLICETRYYRDSELPIAGKARLLLQGFRATHRGEGKVVIAGIQSYQKGISYVQLRIAGLVSYQMLSRINPYAREKRKWRYGAS